MVPEQIRSGAVIRMRSWHGVVLDVFQNGAGRTVLRVQTARNVFRRLGPEFIEVDLAPEDIELATMGDLRSEIATHQKLLGSSVNELLEKALG